MKTLKINSILFLVAAVGFTSCLKENPMNIDPDKGPANILEFANTGSNVAATASTYPRFASDLGTLESGKSATFLVNVSYSGVSDAPQDITVTLGIDTAALRKFNTENSTHYVAPPKEICSFPTTVIIKKGTRKTQIEVTVTNTAQYDYGVEYALPLQIASASIGVISGNFGKAMYSFGIRNKYDGIYSVKGYAFRGAAPGTDALQGPVGPLQKSFSSAGLTTVQWVGSVPWANGGGSNLPAGYEPIITVDEATNKVTLKSSGDFITADPSYDNRYDPATKTFYISFTWGGGPSSRLHTDTLVYVKPR